MIIKKQSIVLYLVVIFLGLPIIGTVLYSFSTEWTNTILPRGLTLQWYEELFSNPLFIQSLKRSLILSMISTLIMLIIMIPTVFVIEVYYQKYQKLLQIFVMLTYSIPGVVMAVALLNVYSNSFIPMIIVVGGSYFLIVLPYVYQGIYNSIKTISAEQLLESARILGANFVVAFMKVVVPNIFPGILVTGMLSFSIMFGEFVIINMVLGGQYETMQIFLKKMMGSNGHIASAVVTSYFIFISIISLIMIKVSKLGNFTLKKVK